MTKRYGERAERYRQIMRRVSQTVAAVATAFSSMTILGAQASSATSHNKLPPAAACTHTDVRETIVATMSAAPSQVVTFTTAIENLSRKTCSVAVGPTSPMMSLTDPSGTVVWNSCYTSGEPGMCAEFLQLIALKPKASYTRKQSWEPSSTSTVLQGTYTLMSRFSGVGWTRTTTFVLSN
jgi:hypothetical protein